MIRVAIIGSGPSGLFVMDQLLRENDTICIDLFDKLPSPYGLLRTGVAPDHQTIKNLQAYYEKIFDRFGSQINFYGNIKIGTDLNIEDLKPYYTALFICTGSESDRPFIIPGVDLAEVVPSRHMVRWYNSHPHYDLNPVNLQKHTAAIIGVGNVSIDIARLLLKPTEELKASDISNRSLHALENSQVNHVHMFARRSPAQAAFTAKEFKELISLPNLKVNIDLQDQSLSTVDLQEIESSSKARSNIDIIKSISASKDTTHTKELSIHFYSQPVEFIGSESLTSIRLEKTHLTGDVFQQKARGTGQFYTVDCDYAFIGIGYVGIEVPGIPFDSDNFVIPNENGRILNNGNPISGLYTAGWIKRGAQGVVGTNRGDAKETVSAFFEDLPTLSAISESDKIDKILKKNNSNWISYQEWLSVNSHEVKLGKEKGCVRVKFESTKDILNYLNK